MKNEKGERKEQVKERERKEGKRTDRSRKKEETKTNNLRE
jgi:hypothetical protein